jgi:hypothetical protein
MAQTMVQMVIINAKTKRPYWAFEAAISIIYTCTRVYGKRNFYEFYYFWN